MHLAPETLAAEAAASPPTVVVNKPSLEVGTIPRVPSCIALPLADAAQEMPQVLHTARRIFVYVHGFRQGFQRVINVASHLALRVGIDTHDGATYGTDEGGGSAVIAFLWPSHKRKFAYSLARSDAREAGLRLRLVLESLMARGSTHSASGPTDLEVVVVAHSMGCRVALHALLDDEQAPAGFKPAGMGGKPVGTGGGASASNPNAAPHGHPPLCSRLVLLGAAVDANVLAPSGEFPRSRLRVGREVIAAYSQHDETLSNYFWFGELASGGGLWSSALGLVGVRGIAERGGDAAAGGSGNGSGGDSDSGVLLTSADMSESVGGHNPNLWLKSAAVLALIDRGSDAPPIKSVPPGAPDGVSP